MLKIVKSGFSSSGRDRIHSEIAELLGKGGRAYLIVPEQQTVMTESLMSELLPPSSALSFEVTNFTRFANTAFRILGGLSGEYCDTSKKALIMWRTLTELIPILTQFAGRREVNAGIVEKSLSAIGEMQSLGIRPEQLAACADSESIKTDARLRDKLSDLSKIYSLYKELLAEKYADTGDDAEVMAKKLLEHPEFLSDTEIFVEGFTSFTKPQYKILGILAERTNLTVSLMLPGGREEAFEFTELRECERGLINSARKRGAKIKLCREEGYGKKTKESLAEICDLLWTSMPQNEKINLQNSEELRIFEANTPFEECDFICSDIKRRVMGGASYSDFAIVALSADKYAGILDSALLKTGIPNFTSYRRDINEFEAIKMIFTAYSAARGFKREDVITYAKCSLTGVSRDECDEFEMYVNKWQINGKRFTEDGVWNMNPRGYTTNRSSETDKKLLRIHKVREKIVGPLALFAEEIEEAKTVKEQASVLLNFLLRVDMENALYQRADAFSAVGEQNYAEENRALWGVICDALDTIVTVLGDTVCDADAFVLQLKVVFSSVNIARIPAYVDEVTVGSADMLRLYEKPHIYMIGVNAGEFPASVGDDSYFSEHDKVLLCQSGLEIPPQLELKNARELYIFSRAFSYANESVTLSYSACNTRFKAIESSEVIKKISELCGVQPKKISRLSSSERLYSAEVALEDMRSLGEDYSTVRAALINSGYERLLNVGEGDITNADQRLGKTVIPGISSQPMYLSQTKIDSFVGCPFAYFCKYKLSLSEDERAEFDARNIGTFIHAILENFFRALGDNGRSASDLSSDEKRELTRSAAEKYIAELGENITVASATTRIKVERLSRAAIPVVEGLCDEFRNSRFVPRFFEMSLSNEDTDSPSLISLKSSDGGDVFIKGTIDRVDTYERGGDIFVRVIDYKTGHKTFSPDDMAEGRNLQMFLYLKAIVDSTDRGFRERMCSTGEFIPAGVIYVKTEVGDVRVEKPDDELAMTAVKAAQKREGMILDDEDVISAMGLRYTPLYSDKTPDKIPEGKRKLLYNREGWIGIMETVEKTVVNVADRMRKGDFSASPKRDRNGTTPCAFCEFKPICRKAELN